MYQRPKYLYSYFLQALDLNLGSFFPVSILKRLTLNFALTFLTDYYKIVPASFLIMSYSFFIAITRQVLKACLAWKQLKVDCSKNILKKKSRGRWHGLLVGYMSVKKLLKTAILLVQERKKGNLCLLKKVGLSTFKEILKKYVYNSTVVFFNVLLFCLKGYAETWDHKKNKTNIDIGKR